MFRSQPQPLNTTLTVLRGAGVDGSEVQQLRELTEEKATRGELRKRQTE